MEDGLVLVIVYANVNGTQVLILVVMEDGLVLNEIDGEEMTSDGS